MAALTSAAMAGDESGTARLDAMFSPLWELFKAHGSLRVMYTAANLMGLSSALPPRPLLPLGSDIAAKVDAAIAPLRED